ncbi:MAG TPA: hypothetical protein VG205_04495 [Acidimicrobiales bacterium]|jgi:hypothetical protein|nr:hypothetical protein [Acidimicrobiales bacterium]
MAHRIEIELTSQTDDATWTWRAAGAKQPRGTVDATLVPAGTSTGAVLRAEVETTLDGTTVLALLPPKGKSAPRKVETIEVVGSPTSGPDVNVVLASKSKGRRRDDRSDGPREGSRDGARRPADRRPRSESGERGPRRDAPDRAGARTGGGDGTRDGAPSDRRRDRPARPGGREGGQREGPRRPAQSTTYRNAALATLKPEQLPVAEQLLRGGIPAVRQAIEEQNARARAESRTEVTPGPLLTLAEELLPIITLAAWKDRASVARNEGKDTPLRELRSIVASASTVTLDEEGRDFLKALRAALDLRVTALRDGWVQRISIALDEGRVADALRVSIRPPEPATRLSAELAVRLADSAGQAMSSESTPADWLAVLEVVVDSPVRRNVKPAGLPAGADEALLVAANKASGYVPELAKLLGLPIPPPPGPRRPVPARSTPSRRRG